jgi:signal transduction histidine kinase
MSGPAGWVAYGVAWAAATLFWALASASGSGMSPLQTLPYAVFAMGSAAVMGVGVWRLTGRLSWDWRAPAFVAVHALALAAFSIVYATSWIWLDAVRGEFARALAEVPRSPVLLWNLLMGSWLYLIVAGLSYAVRAQRKARAHEAAAAEAQVLAQQAQLAALRAQINPHFLFNALHSVGALVGSDPAGADQALERLGDLLRYALHAGDQVPLRNELAFTMDYLALEQLRYGDRLRLSRQVDDAAEAVLVPPLILQPLVENAVRHGIADRSAGGSIQLTARVDGGRCRLTVTDDGEGARESSSAGVGLASVSRRLSALYGPRARLTVEQRHRGFGVSIDLPLQRDGQD